MAAAVEAAAAAMTTAAARRRAPRASGRRGCWRAPAVRRRWSRGRRGRCAPRPGGGGPCGRRRRAPRTRRHRRRRRGWISARGRLVGASRWLISARGRLVTASRWLVGASRWLISAHGRLVTASRWLVGARGRLVGASRQRGHASGSTRRRAPRGWRQARPATVGRRQPVIAHLLRTAGAACRRESCPRREPVAHQSCRADGGPGPYRRGRHRRRHAQVLGEIAVQMRADVRPPQVGDRRELPVRVVQSRGLPRSASRRTISR